jgi:uncharacterized membrane protein YbaN (DUF454 family)
MSRTLRVILILSGTLALIMAMVGIILPVMPTTPFLLLSAACYTRSSQRLYQWLMNHRVFGSAIRDYMLYKAVRRKTRLFALLFLWTSLITSAILVGRPLVCGILAIVGISVSIHLLSLNTMPSSTTSGKTKNAAATPDGKAALEKPKCDCDDRTSSGSYPH